MSKKYNILEFAEYLNIDNQKSDDILIVLFDNESNILLKSNPVKIDFYILAIKAGFYKNVDYGQTDFDDAQYYLYFDPPESVLEWDLQKPMTGYSIFISPKIFDKYAKGYSIINYDSHEALFLNDNEKDVLMYLFKKAHSESQKDQLSKEIVASYTNLILSYAKKYYQRQFQTRSILYNKVVADFHKNIEAYFEQNENNKNLPTVSYFADLANLSPNYFSDLIKHFTGNSAQQQIHKYLLQKAKRKLRQSDLSISEIAYSLGFAYPTYFTRFFKKEVGLTPTAYRNK
jgi:AraC-like DNA-binding protein